MSNGLPNLVTYIRLLNSLNPEPHIYMYIYLDIYIYIYVYDMYMSMHIYIYICIHIYPLSRNIGTCIKFLNSNPGEAGLEPGDALTLQVRQTIAARMP